MIDDLTIIRDNQIILEDNSQFFFMIRPFEMINSLGKVIAVLKEYVFIKKGESSEQNSCRLYKTKEGNWYDLHDNNSATENRLSLSLKTAVDRQESGLNKFTFSI